MVNFINKKKNTNKKPKISFRVNPHSHWKFLLRLFTILSVLLIVFGLYIFYQINQDQIFRVEVVEPTKRNILKEKLLENIIISFEEKKVNKNSVIDNKIEFRDPSN